MKLLAATLPALMLLSACNSEPAPKPQAQGAGTASGEVLEGSISDAMLPLDTVTSHSPPLEVATPSVTASGEPDKAPAAESSSAAAAPGQPAAEEPAAEN